MDTKELIIGLANELEDYFFYDNDQLINCGYCVTQIEGVAHEGEDLILSLSANWGRSHFYGLLKNGDIYQLSISHEEVKGSHTWNGDDAYYQ